MSFLRIIAIFAVLSAGIAFAGQVEGMLNDDFSRCRQVSSEEIRNKPAWFPLAMSIARLFAPVL